MFSATEAMHQFGAFLHYFGEKGIPAPGIHHATPAPRTVLTLAEPSARVYLCHSHLLW